MMRRLLCALTLCCLFATACSAVPQITPTQNAAANNSAPAVLSHVGSAGADDVVSVPEAVPGMGRDQAVAQLSEVAFLAYSDAACVIDALYDEVGVYDFTSAVANAQANQAELIQSCLEEPVVEESVTVTTVVEPDESEEAGTEAPDAGAPDFSGVGEADTDTDTNTDQSDEDSGLSGNPTPGQSAGDGPADVDATEVDAAEATASDAEQPVFVPGAVATGAAEVAGLRLGYAVITPDGFQAGDTAPVLINLPENGYDLDTTRSLIQSVFLNAALSAGWVIVSPSLPGGDWTDPQTANVVADLTRWISTWVEIEGGRPHLGGFGGGGSGAFDVAAQNPSAFRSLMVSPGQPPQLLEPAAERLAQLPVRMWVVNNEGNPWIAGMTAADEMIRENGGDVVLNVLSVEDVINLGGDPALGRWILSDIRWLG